MAFNKITNRDAFGKIHKKLCLRVLSKKKNFEVKGLFLPFNKRNKRSLLGKCSNVKFFAFNSIRSFVIIGDCLYSFN